MRAPVFDSQEPVAKVEDRNVVARYLDRTAFAQGNVFRLRDADPVFFLRVARGHWHTFSIGWI
jgi:phage-related protein